MEPQNLRIFMSKRLCIIGSSGFAREVMDIALDTGYDTFVFADGYTKSTEVAGAKVLPDTDQVLGKLREEGWDFAIGIGAPATRRKIANRLIGFAFPPLIHPSATFGRDQEKVARSAAGVLICAGVRFTNNIDIGDHSLFNLNVTIGHDTIIRNFVSIMPGANVSGNVLLEEGVYVGTGASIIHGGYDEKLVIGHDATIGAGAVANRNIPAGVTAVGVPAKPLNFT